MFKCLNRFLRASICCVYSRSTIIIITTSVPLISIITVADANHLLNNLRGTHRLIQTQALLMVLTIVNCFAVAVVGGAVAVRPAEHVNEEFGDERTQECLMQARDQAVVASLEWV